MSGDERRSKHETGNLQLIDPARPFFGITGTPTAEHPQRPNLIGSIRLNLDLVTSVLTSRAELGRLPKHS